MIYLLSDIHGEIDFPGLKEYLSKGTEEDLLIILGDIGLKFEQTDGGDCFTEEFLSFKKKIAFLDGNHENFEYLNSFCDEKWNGGTVHRLTDYIVHLKRGNIYTIEGKHFFVFGGCKSSHKWKKIGLWYPEEEPTEEECAFAFRNLKEYGNKVNYILTHKYEQGFEDDSLVCKNLQKMCIHIDENIQFEKWYAGHLHINRRVDERHFIVFDTLTELD